MSIFHAQKCVCPIRKTLPKLCSAQYHSSITGVYGYNPSRAKRGNKEHGTTQLTSLLTSEAVANRCSNFNVVQLVDAYRSHGHKKAALDPLGLKKENQRKLPELDLQQYGLSLGNNHSFSTQGILFTKDNEMNVSDLVKRLDRVYCGSLAVEFQHLNSLEERQWFAETFESRIDEDILTERKVDLAKLMLRCQAFDNFVATKFATVKRYGGEGCESMMGFFDEVFQKSAQHDVKDIVMCMPHRGRLNFMTCMLNFPPVIMFRKMKGLSELPEGARGVGDVLSHLYTSTDLNYDGKSVHVSLIPNPSHLEANNPVAAGKTRSKMQTLKKGDYDLTGKEVLPGEGVLCLQVHGDASFVGQGVVAETFCFADAPHFDVGGSVHLIVNNQVGFTTESERGRSSFYSSDMAKVNGYPVIHINADYPEDVVKATSIAMDYRNKFRRDVIIDLICYRRWGHNEIDEPAFTQPIMYRTINARRSIPDQYAETMVSSGLSDQSSLTESVQQWTTQLNENLAAVDSHVSKPFHLQDKWSSLAQAGDDITTWDTGVSLDTLKYVGAASATVPEDMVAHPTIQKTHLDRRRQKMVAGTELDWATGEALAFGSLLHQGFNVRISGQDVGRGTFSNRHCMVVDQETDQIHIPLNHMTEKQTGFLEVANSVLSEEAVLGFEYGLSIDSPNNLVIWEAQFGDFFNAAQPMIDTYVSSGELKWLLQSGIIMLLPHGMDGAGPEHSSCRIERFLQMCDSKEDKVDSDDVNMQIVNATTPAQYFHLLRRQMIRNYRKPLIVASPKMILRHPAATSSLSDMLPGTHFVPVIPDPIAKGADVKRVVFCSGKHYYALVAERESRGAHDTAFVRLESLCPFPVADIQKVLNSYPKAESFVWSQEEHRNMGAWSFVAPRFQNLIGRQLKYAGRDVLGTPAVGVVATHKLEITDLMNQAFL